MLEMRVTGLGLDAASKTPVVYLRQVDGEARLSILVGAMEALSISLMLNGEQLPRPLTHDLLLMCLKAMGARLGGVEICDMRDGLYLAARSGPRPPFSPKAPCSLRAGRTPHRPAPPPPLRAKAPSGPTPPRTWPGRPRPGARRTS